jgi:hypothetical protein
MSFAACPAFGRDARHRGCLAVVTPFAVLPGFAEVFAGFSCHDRGLSGIRSVLTLTLRTGGGYKSNTSTAQYRPAYRTTISYGQTSSAIFLAFPKPETMRATGPSGTGQIRSVAGARACYGGPTWATWPKWIECRGRLPHCHTVWRNLV